MRMIDLVGQQLGNYRVTQLLADAGGFGDVYLGEHVELGAHVAIKVLKASLPQDEIAKFRTEATTIAKLIHPNIVRVFDYGVRGNIPYMVMDYAPNGTLGQRYPSGKPVTLNTVVPYVKQIADALQYAHDAKIIHRDIKPENMLIGRRNEVLLSDFGIAVIAHSTHSMILQDKAGTLAYMAPEQLQGKPTLASDQYALGIVVYEWLCGEAPFTGTVLEMLTQHLSVAPPPLRVKVPSIPPAVEQVVLRALAKDPPQRFASVLEFAAAFEQACQSQQPTILPTPPISPPLPLPPTVPIASLPKYTVQQFPPNTITPPLVIENPTTADIEAMSTSKKNAYTPLMQNLILDGKPSSIWKRLRRNNNEYVWATNSSDEMAYIQFTKQIIELTNFTFQAEIEFPNLYSTTSWALVFRLYNQNVGYNLYLSNHEGNIGYQLQILRVKSIILNRKSLLFNHQPERLLASGAIRWVPKVEKMFSDIIYSRLLLGIVAQGSTIDLYGNLQHLMRVNDHTVDSGELCLYSAEGNPVRCVRAKVWTP